MPKKTNPGKTKITKGWTMVSVRRETHARVKALCLASGMKLQRTADLAFGIGLDAIEKEEKP